MTTSSSFIISQKAMELTPQEQERVIGFIAGITFNPNEKSEDKDDESQSTNDHK